MKYRKVSENQLEIGKLYAIRYEPNSRDTYWKYDGEGFEFFFDEEEVGWTYSYYDELKGRGSQIIGLTAVSQEEEDRITALKSSIKIKELI